MEFPNPKIKYYRIRAFGERLSVSFDYLRETWKPMLKFSLYLILPICLIQSFSTNAVTRYAFTLGYESGPGGDLGTNITYFVIHYAVYALCLLIGSAILTSLVYTLMQEYERRETRLLDIRWIDFKPLLIKNFKKIIAVSLFFLAVVSAVAAVIILLAVLSPWTLIVTLLLTFAALFAFAIPAAMFIPVYIFEDEAFMPALQKSFSYGFKAWGEIFLITLVFGLIANIISSVTMMPWYILTLMGSILGVTDPGSGFDHQPWYLFLIYILAIVQGYGSYISAIVTSVGYAFQYFHLREKIEGVSVRDSIQNFDKL
jgi:hypothetical protein